jgi:hypothetical protein
MVIPLLAALREKKIGIYKKGLLLSGLIFLCAAATAMFYFPFGLNGDYFNGIKMLTNTGSYPETLTIFSFALTNFFHYSNNLLRIIGVLGALLIALIFSWKKEYLFAFSWPLIFALLFGFPTVYPWYFLWVYPMLLILVPVDIFVFITVLLILATDVVWPLNLSVVAFIYLYVRLFRKDIPVLSKFIANKFS